MKLLWIFALFVILVSPTFAKQKPNATRPLSGYMRRVGLLYLEEVDTLTDGDDFFDRSMAWGDTLDELEDRITITLSESVRPSYDNLFFKMLKNTRFAHFMRRGCFDGDKCALWEKADRFCRSRAHETTLDGVLQGSDFKTCADAIKSALDADEVRKSRRAQ
jgi:hypothetical protein